MSNVENVKKTAKPESELSPYYIKALERFVKDGDPFEWSCNYATFRELVHALSLEKIKGEDVIRYSAYNTVTGYETDSVEREYPPLEGVIAIETLLDYIADTQGIWADDPNDFKATVMVKFDETTTAAIGLESSEDIQACDDCWALEHQEDADEAKIAQFNNRNFTCDHSITTFNQSYWIALFNSEDNENYPGWNHWSLEYTDMKAARIEHDIRDLEHEVREGITNLSRLKTGDLLRIVAKRSQSSKDAMYRPLTDEQAAQRFVYDFTVLEEGIYPVVEYQAASGQAEKTVLIGGEVWTNRRQNPVQNQETALTITYGTMQPELRVVSKNVATGETSYSETVIESIEVLKV